MGLGNSDIRDACRVSVAIKKIVTCSYPPFFDNHPFEIYEKILIGKITFPTQFQAEAIDIVSQLLTADITKRLGNMKGGAEDVKSHLWYRNLNWTALIQKRIRAPIIPTTTHAGDSRNFDVYPELSESEFHSPAGDQHAEHFQGKFTIFKETFFISRFLMQGKLSVDNILKQLEQCALNCSCNNTVPFKFLF